MTMPETTASDEMDPIEIPWPPVQELPVKTMFDPLFYHPKEKKGEKRHAFGPPSTHSSEAIVLVVDHTILDSLWRSSVEFA